MSWVKISGTTQINFKISNFKYYFYAEASQELLNISVIKELLQEETDQPIDNVTIGSIKIVTCMGCVENQPTQLAHMDEGGCLY